MTAPTKAQLDALRQIRDGDRAEHDPNAPLHTSPHYSDERFSRDPQTVHGGEMEGLSYVYDDRLWQWDGDKMDTAIKAADASGAPSRSARWYSALISAYEGKLLTVYHVIAGVSVSSGYPYYVLGYCDATAKERALDGAKE